MGGVRSFPIGWARGIVACFLCMLLQPSAAFDGLHFKSEIIAHDDPRITVLDTTSRRFAIDSWDYVTFTRQPIRCRKADGSLTLHPFDPDHCPELASRFPKCDLPPEPGIIDWQGDPGGSTDAARREGYLFNASCRPLSALPLRIVISGHEIDLNATVDPKRVYERLVESNPDIGELEIFADRLLISSPVIASQANLEIVARHLDFANDGALNVTPLGEWPDARPALWCPKGYVPGNPEPRDGYARVRRDGQMSLEPFKVMEWTACVLGPSEEARAETGMLPEILPFSPSGRPADNGRDGHQGGVITLNIRKLTCNGTDECRDGVRFVVDGGKPQAGGVGANGWHSPKAAKVVSKDEYLAFCRTHYSWTKSRDRNRICNGLANAHFIPGLIYVRFADNPFKLAFVNLRFPEAASASGGPVADRDGYDALPSGIAGAPGSPGQVIFPPAILALPIKELISGSPGTVDAVEYGPYVGGRPNICNYIQGQKSEECTASWICLQADCDKHCPRVTGCPLQRGLETPEVFLHTFAPQPGKSIAAHSSKSTIIGAGSGGKVRIDLEEVLKPVASIHEAIRSTIRGRSGRPVVGSVDPPMTRQSEADGPPVDLDDDDSEVHGLSVPARLVSSIGNETAESALAESKSLQIDTRSNMAISASLAMARDSLLFGNRERAATILDNTEETLNAILSTSTDADSATSELVSEHSRVRALLESGLDYFGNPPGYVPTQSVQYLANAYETELSRYASLAALAILVDKLHENQTLREEALSLSLRQLEQEQADRRNTLRNRYQTLAQVSQRASDVLGAEHAFQNRLRSLNDAIEQEARADIRAQEQAAKRRAERKVTVRVFATVAGMATGTYPALNMAIDHAEKLASGSRDPMTLITDIAAAYDDVQRAFAESGEDGDFEKIVDDLSTGVRSFGDVVATVSSSFKDPDVRQATLDYFRSLSSDVSSTFVVAEGNLRHGPPIDEDLTPLTNATFLNASAHYSSRLKADSTKQVVDLIDRHCRLPRGGATNLLAEWDPVAPPRNRPPTADDLIRFQLDLINQVESLLADSPPLSACKRHREIISTLHQWKPPPPPQELVKIYEQLMRSQSDAMNAYSRIDQRVRIFRDSARHEHQQISPSQLEAIIQHYKAQKSYTEVAEQLGQLVAMRSDFLRDVHRAALAVSHDLYILSANLSEQRAVRDLFDAERSQDHHVHRTVQSLKLRARERLIALQYDYARAHGYYLGQPIDMNLRIVDSLDRLVDHLAGATASNAIAGTTGSPVSWELIGKAAAAMLNEELGHISGDAMLAGSRITRDRPRDFPLTPEEIARLASGEIITLSPGARISEIWPESVLGRSLKLLDLTIDRLTFPDGTKAQRGVFHFEAAVSEWLIESSREGGRLIYVKQCDPPLERTAGDRCDPDLVFRLTRETRFFSRQPRSVDLIPVESRQIESYLCAHNRGSTTCADNQWFVLPGLYTPIQIRMELPTDAPDFVAPDSVHIGVKFFGMRPWNEAGLQH